MTRQKQKRPRTYARNRAASVSRSATEKVFETDSTYFLKLVIVVLLGMFWLRFGGDQTVTWFGVHITGIPIGTLAGLLLIHQFEKHQSDRKIWYVVLILVSIICYFYPTGVML